MPWKEKVTAEDVNAYRAIVAKARSLDEDIDRGLITPHEATEALKAAFNPKKKEA